MKHRGLFLIVGALALGLMPARGEAQQRVGRYVVGRDGEPDMAATRRGARSAFQLFANKDAGYSDLRSVGIFRAVCVENYSGLWYFCGNYFLGVGNAILPGGLENTYLSEGMFSWGVPKGEWLRHQAADTGQGIAPSLQYALGGGWTAQSVDDGAGDDTGPGDNSLGITHAGVQSTSDGSCRDHRNSIGAGNPLLAGFNCPVTWGSAGWQGSRPISGDVWKARFTAEGNAFRWDSHVITDAERDLAGIPPAAAKAIGSFQTYYVTTDANSDILAGGSGLLTYGKVVPGGVGNPTRTGWPLGLDVRVDAFTFQIPALKDVSFYQAFIVNNSARVYGVGLNYDSLYINLNPAFYNQATQFSQRYTNHQTGSVLGMHGTVRACDPSRVAVDLSCDTYWGVGSREAFNRGAAAMIVLKSPIGDMRNKLFTRKEDGSPCVVGDAAAPFCNPTHPLRGDTLTFNHHHYCGFRACARNSVATAPSIPDHEQRVFGMLSSIDNDVLGTRTASGLTDQVFWHTFRPYGFLNRTPDPVTGGWFSRWLPPGNWDYNHDGLRDTIFDDMCNYRNGCAAVFGDTMPNGKIAGYGNVFGQLGVGPISLAAGDTVEFMIAATAAVDSFGIVSQINAAMSAYLNFFLGPEVAPPTHVVATEATPSGGPTAIGSSGNTVKLFWDRSAVNYTDVFISKYLADLMLALGAPSPQSLAPGRLGLLNPQLDDTLLFLTTNNLLRLHVFKSCDGGGSWTDDNDCTGDPALGGTFRDLGWQPWRTYNADDGIPSSLEDLAVSPGRTYTYTFVGETRGVNLTLMNGDSITQIGGVWTCVRNCRMETLALAPSLINALTASTGDPNVARVYVPASVQAGATRASAAVSAAGPMRAGRLEVGLAGDSMASGTYKVRFGDNGRVVQVTYRTASRVDSVRTSATLLDGTAVVAPSPLTGRNLGGVTVSGGATTTTGGGAVTRDSTVFSSTVMVLSRVSGSSEEPLLMSSTLTPDATTPGVFLAHRDFPGFTVSVDEGLFAGTQFESQEYLSVGDTTHIALLAEPAPIWLRSGAVPTRTASTDPVPAGVYSFKWADRAFGPGEPFTLNLVDRTAVETAIASSLTSRAVGQTGDVTVPVAALVGTALGRPAITIDSLVAVKLPFTVRNLSYNRPVTVAMLKRARNAILLGTGADTMRAAIPADQWVPGDRLILLEPSSTSALAVTWTLTSVACDPGKFTRESCNPIRMRTTGGTQWISPDPDMQLRVSYFTPVTSASVFTISTSAPVRGANLLANADAIRAGLAAVRVVPNPYVAFSQFGGNLMFTHVPPRGVIRIYTVAGQFVQQISWTESDVSTSGDLLFNLRTREGNLMGAGLYVYVLRAQDATDNTIGTRTGKFVIIN